VKAVASAMQQQYANGGCRRGSGAVIMPMHRVHCSVSGTRIYRVTDLEDHVIQMICPEYDKATCTCRIRCTPLGGGPLEQFLERPSEDTLANRGARCVLS
jgi:hypothetical protein